MKKSIVVAAILLLLGLQANAQIIPGAGYIYSSEKTKGVDGSTPYHGFFIGASYNFHIVAGLGVAPGLYASFLTHKKNDVKGSSKIGYNLNYYLREFALNVPINLNYVIEFGHDKAIFAYAGPVFQLGITNTTSVNGSATSGGINLSDGTSWDNYSKGYAGGYWPVTSYPNRFNIYLGGGLGFQMGDILIHVGYDRSLMNIDRETNDVISRGQLKIGFGLEF